MKKKSTGGGKLFSLVFKSLFIMGTIGMSIIPYKMFKTIITGNKTVGIVTSVVDVGDESPAYSVSAIYDCGSIKGIEGKSIGESSTYHYDVGESIVVYCDEKDPGTFVLDTYVNYLLLIFPIILWSLMIMFIKSALRSRRIEKFKKNSMKVSAIVDEIIPGKAKYTKLYGCIIKAKYSGNIFLSEFVNGDVEKIVKVGDKIDLYISYDDLTKYWVDIDKIARKIDELGDFGEKYEDDDEIGEDEKVVD